MAARSGVYRAYLMSLPLSQARAAVVREVSALAPARPRTELVALGEALGRVLAVDVAADRDQPPFHRSTRDGFAVRAADLTDAGPDHPISLRLAGEVAAGARFGGSVEPGTCVEIMTGAPLPDGADAVVMVEHVERAGEATGAVIQVRRPLGPGENVVPRGSELAAGARACGAGTRLDPAAIGLLASLGLARPEVVARPRVAVLATGDELVPVEATPAPSQIRDSNRHTLAAQILRAGGEPRPQPIVRDDPGALKAALAAAVADADLLLVSGGVSMGKYDYVEGALAALGARVVFDGVDIRPGKPLVFGAIGGQAGGRAIPFFGLPGNPLSTLVTFELFVRPALAVLAGASPGPPSAAAARLAVDYAQRKLSLTVLVPAAWVPPGEGSGQQLPLGAVRPVPSQGSGDLASMAAADVLMIVEPGTTSLAAGSLVPILPK